MWKKIDVSFNENGFSFIKGAIIDQFPEKYRKDLKIETNYRVKKIEIELLQDKDKLLLRAGIFNLSVDHHNEEILNIFKQIYGQIKSSIRFFNYLSLNEEMSYNRYTLIGLMARGLAHEINNPLAIISTYIQLFNMQEKAEEKKEIYKNILHAIDRASNIVMNISQFAKTEGKKELLDLNNNIPNILEFFENIRKYQFPDVEIDFKPNQKESTVLINKNDLYEIVYLLLVNACEAMKNSKKKVVKISIEKSKFNTILRIEDFGKGINKENLENVYKPFFTTKREKNLGLGLSIVKYLIDKNGCDINIKSTYNKGTIVSIVIGGEYEDTFSGRRSFNEG